MPRVLQNVSPWMSLDLPKGDRWSETIGRQLSELHVGLICVTPESSDAKWLMFEAGALSKSLGLARVCPVLLGMRPTDLSGPLTLFQATVFEKADMLQLMRSLNAELGEAGVADHILRDAFDAAWPGLVARVETASALEIGAENVEHVIRACANHGLPEPAIGRDAYFREGFESHAIYSVACEVARRRLFVFGRKNRKLFDKEHRDFFAGLNVKCKNGFDFRCLFLDPRSPDDVLASAHPDPDFRRQLFDCVGNAVRRLVDTQLDPETCARFYRSHRSLTFIVIDDAIAYTPIRFNANGTAATLTKAPFTVIGAGSALGADLIEQFISLWDGGEPITAAGV